MKMNIAKALAAAVTTFALVFLSCANEVIPDGGFIDGGRKLIGGGRCRPLRLSRLRALPYRFGRVPLRRCPGKERRSA